VPTTGSLGVTLPPALLPTDGGRNDEAARRRSTALRPVPGTPPTLVQACRNALAVAAASYGGVQVEAVSAGEAQALEDGTISAPVAARITYARGRLRQIRAAEVDCRLDGDGQVVATL
jgi:hypothetical protein